MNKMESIEMIEGDYWGKPPEDAPRLVKRCYLLRHTPIGHLEIEDLRQLLSQEIGVNVILPLTVDILERDILAEGDFYPGDLLQSVLNVNNMYWSNQPQLKKRLQSILREQKGEVETRKLSQDIRRDLNITINQFLVEE